MIREMFRPEEEEEGEGEEEGEIGRGRGTQVNPSNTYARGADQ